MFHIFRAHSVKGVERSEVFWNNIRKNTSKFPELMVDETMALNAWGLLYNGLQFMLAGKRDLDLYGAICPA
jgi:hypothetical protein